MSEMKFLVSLCLTYMARGLVGLGKSTRAGGAAVRPWCDHVRCRDAVDQAKAVRVSLLHDNAHVESLTVPSRFRTDFHHCLTARADALFELTDAMLCADGPVTTLVALALAPEHRRGHGALYAGMDRGRMDVDRLRRALVSAAPLPKAADGRLVLTVDVSPWLRPDADTAPVNCWSNPPSPVSCRPSDRARSTRRSLNTPGMSHHALVSVPASGGCGRWRGLLSYLDMPCPTSV